MKPKEFFKNIQFKKWDEGDKKEWDKYEDKDCVVCCLKKKRGEKIIIVIDYKNNKLVCFAKLGSFYVCYDDDIYAMNYYLRLKRFIMDYKDEKKWKEMQDIFLIKDI